MLVSTLILLAYSPSELVALDYVLCIGGGPTATSSEVSIEQNVLRFHEVLRQAGQTPIATLFGGGKSKAIDVCYRDNKPIPTLHRLLAELFGSASGLELSFRPNAVAAVDAPATRAEILSRLDEASKRLQAGDRFVLFVTGHGARGDARRNAHYLTWLNDKVGVREFAQALDRFSAGVEVVYVMVQCYSGSFANAAFTAGDPAAGWSGHLRAGFFATAEELPAAGCTPDGHSPHNHEYAAWFLAALQGKTNVGEPLEADLDRDGKVQLDEAHACVAALGDSIDIPLKTSDLFLREYSRSDQRGSNRLRLDEYFSRITGFAAPPERFVLEQVSRRLKLGGENRVAEARRKADQIGFDRDQTAKQIDGIQNRIRTHRNRIAEDVARAWPYLREPWHPDTLALIGAPGQESAAVLQAITQHPDYAEWHKQNAELDKLKGQDTEDRRTWALCHRLVRAAEHVVLAHNLRIDGSTELQRQFTALIGLEHSTLNRTAKESSKKNG